MEFLHTCLEYTLHLDTHLMNCIAEYGPWIYALLFCIIFCETGLVVTPFLPGDSLLFACGVAAGSGLLGYGETMALLCAAGIAGDACNYMIGRRVGPIIFQRDTRYIKKAHLLKTQAFYEKHGGKAILLARFIPIVRTFAPFVAGIARMRLASFFLYNCTGCLLWVCGLVSCGYFFGHLPWVAGHFSLIVLAIILVSLLPLVLAFVRAR
ncbi:MAG: VTT domain-containing protein [Desulfovibrionaceae bacterium]|nr:VTT domain-containing protein [Desulfovibrionaceae bacterium]